MQERPQLPVPIADPDRCGSSIESGYFVFTLMPSLYCHLRCPHCYLSVEEREDRTILSPELLMEACRKIDAYWNERGIKDRTVVCYWYGGEPTSMGIPMFLRMVEGINSVFRPEDGYKLKHTVLTSLVSVRNDWFPVFAEYGAGEVQTSYDGEMRGSAYVRKWERRVRDAVRYGLRISTISVVNRELITKGPRATLDYLTELGVAETSWLPFMWNEQNSNGSYDRYAPTMNEWSHFMCELTEHWMARRREGTDVPEIGQMRFILSQAERSNLANIAAQTLFLMPNGDFVLPDYRDGWLEFMRPFGNILRQSFADVLSSPARRAYLRRQALRNGNSDCMACDHHDKCVMEFWKDNRPGDDCFGGRRYVEWLLSRRQDISRLIGSDASTLLY